MEVTKHGKYFRLLVCPTCECEFRFEKNEILTKRTVNDAFGYIYEADYINCPECKRHIILDERVIEI